jgi:hypothetical protein
MKNLSSYDSLFESYLPPVTDQEILAATLVGEAGGEVDKTKGMTAVLNVLKNRATQKGTTKAGEALRPFRFSMWNSATKNVSNKSDYRISDIKTIVNKWKLHVSWSSALALIKSNPKDITGGANCYYAYKGPNAVPPPDFTKGWKETANIGNHKFGYVEKL